MGIWDQRTLSAGLHLAVDASMLKIIRALSLQGLHHLLPPGVNLNLNLSLSLKVSLRSAFGSMLGRTRIRRGKTSYRGRVDGCDEQVVWG